MKYIILEKARVKPFVRTRKGKMEQVKSHERNYKLVSSKALRFGTKRAKYQLKDGRIITVIHDRYGTDMRRGYALNSHSKVYIDAREGDLEGQVKVFKDDSYSKVKAGTYKGNEEKAANFLKKKFGIEHDPSMFKENLK